MDGNLVGTECPLLDLAVPLQRLMRFERFHVHKREMFLNGDPCSTFDIRYLPWNCGAFELPCYWIERKHFYVYGDLPCGYYQGSDYGRHLLFPVHPAEIGQYRAFLLETGARDAREDGLQTWAVPTSSTRTLLAWQAGKPSSAMFLKLSLHSPIFGDRHIYRRKVAAAVGLSKLMADSLASLPGKIRFMFEPAGFVPRSMTDSGVLIRAIPRELMHGDRQIAPLFSLYGGSGQYRPLLLTLSETNGLEIEDFVETVLCRAFASIWVDMAMLCGLILEAHGQDLLIYMARADARPSAFYYRDFEGLQVDWELRNRCCPSGPGDMPNAHSWFETYETWGYPRYQLAFCKLKQSLTHYLEFVLRQLEGELVTWHDMGLTGRRHFGPGDITSLFSWHLRRAIHQRFGVRESREYDIARSLDRFVLFLMKTRRDRLEAYPPLERRF